MKPALVKKWIDGLYPTHDDSNPDTTQHVPERTAPALPKTSHGFTIPSPRLSSCKSPQLKEPMSPL
jgi:hypothetical protein